MGQKTNPISNRIGIIRGWDSNWYGGTDYASRILEDAKIREYLNARISKVNLSKIVIERTTIKNGRYVREGITSSGILIVRPLHEDKIITAFMVRVEKAASVCHGAGKKQIPPKLYEKIVKNAQRHPELFNI